MAKALIIGYGNPLRGDDGLGWHVAHALEREGYGEDVEIIACHQLTPELAEPVSQAELVVFVDARWDGTPGSCADQTVVPRSAEAGSFSHACDPAALLGWGKDLYGGCPQAVMLSVTGESFAHGEGLSPRVLAALPVLRGQIRRIVAHARQRRRIEEDGRDA
jgi:hydrogenase maturation protease